MVDGAGLSTQSQKNHILYRRADKGRHPPLLNTGLRRYNKLDLIRASFTIRGSTNIVLFSAVALFVIGCVLLDVIR